MDMFYHNDDDVGGGRDAVLERETRLMAVWIEMPGWLLGRTLSVSLLTIGYLIFADVMITVC